MITISLCMIVKNEERVLARCLDSLSGLMDEIIIVDTGSTDRTKEIAGQYTDKIYDFTWIDDFAAARNFSFSKATMEYIYVADADEVLDEKNRQEFMKLKQAMLPEVEIVQMYYGNQTSYNTTYNYDKEYRPKLYKRLRQFQWIEPVHECVNTEPIVFDSDVVVFHMPEGLHAKRDFTTFQKMIQRGQRISKRLHNMYARELSIAGEDEDFLNAEAFFANAIKDPSRTLDEIKEAAYVLLRCARIKEDVVAFFTYALKDAVSEASSEICYELGAFYQEREEYEEACNWYLNAMEACQPILNVKYKEEYPRKGICACYEILAEQFLREGKKETAEEYRKAIATLQKKEYNCNS